jgi:hypothetical protein
MYTCEIICVVLLSRALSSVSFHVPMWEDEDIGREVGLLIS